MKFIIWLFMTSFIVAVLWVLIGPMIMHVLNSL
jgi:hypothetical protein